MGSNYEFRPKACASYPPLAGIRVKSVTRKTNHFELLLNDSRTITAAVVVGADGVSSMVGCETGLHAKWAKNEITVCRVVEIPAKTDEILDRYTENLNYHFFANLSGLPGYGWIFPKRDTINVGVGIIGSHAKGLPNLFDLYVRF